jgi:hypothetical protein
MPNRNKAIVMLDEQVLAAMFKLPDGIRVVSVRADWERNAIQVMLEGEGLPEVAPGCVPPTLCDGEVELDEDGRPRIRLPQVAGFGR